MSADSPRRPSKGSGVCVRPQPVNDKTVMESVVDFFQDVAYSGGQRQPDDKEKIQWIRFEETDLNDVNANPDCSAQSGNTPPLLLVLGYTNGVQVWSIAANGEAQEVLSLRQGPVRTFRLLKTPTVTFPDRPDIYASKRPLVALCDASSAGQPYCCVKFVSLRAGDEVHNVSFSHSVSDIRANERVLIVAFPERIAAFDACQFKQTFWITSCYPSPGPDLNPIALGTRWLAYADRKLIPVHQSGGGMEGDGAQSYAATVISAAKTITKGLTMFGETVASSLAGTKKKESSGGPGKDDKQPGIVTVIDMVNIGEGQISVQEDAEGDGLVAHFPAHTSEPIASMEFDPSGIMLLTADKLGHNFHLFRIMAHPYSCSLGAVHHLYTLHRGDTTAEVQDIAFTQDSRWVAVSTLRGTTHVFPITPYGGAVSVRTHTHHRVVNRASRFHRSAGIDELEPQATGRHSPIPSASGSPSSSPGRQEHYRNVLYQNTINNNLSNPRLPPYPHPTTVYPVVQVKQMLSIPGMPSSSAASAKGKSSGPTSPKDDSFCVATCFARSRGWVAGSPVVAKDKTDEKAVHSLYVCNWLGALTEYVLEPHAKLSAASDKVTDDSPLEVDDAPRATWPLSRSATSGELKPPLGSNNPLIIGNDAVVHQRPSSSDLLASQGLMCRQESKESLSSDHSGSAPSGDSDDQWLSQVEIITHAGPHRRLWMGPQFSFKTFQGSSTTTVLSTNSSVLLSHSPDQTPTTTDIISDELDLQSLKIAAFEDSLKDWNPRPLIPEDSSETAPKCSVDTIGPRIVKAATLPPHVTGPSFDRTSDAAIEKSKETKVAKVSSEAKGCAAAPPKSSNPWQVKTPSQGTSSQGLSLRPGGSTNQQLSAASKHKTELEVSITCNIDPPVEEYFSDDQPVSLAGKTGWTDVGASAKQVEIPAGGAKGKSKKKKTGAESTSATASSAKAEPPVDSAKSKSKKRSKKGVGESEEAPANSAAVPEVAKMNVLELRQSSQVAEASDEVENLETTQLTEGASAAEKQAAVEAEKKKKIAEADKALDALTKELEESMVASQAGWSESGKKSRKKNKKGKGNADPAAPAEPPRVEAKTAEAEDTAAAEGKPKRAMALEKHRQRLMPARSSPVAMPRGRHSRLSGGEWSSSPGIETSIEAGSYEQSEELEHWAEGVAPVQSAVADDRIRETLADAMLESPDKDAAATAAKKSRKRDL